MSLEKVNLVHGLIVLGLLLMAAFSQGYKLSQVVRYTAGWSAIAFVIFVAYSYQSELTGIKQRLMGQLIPAKVRENADGSISFTRDNRGHFHVNALIKGKTIQFMVDTGATRTVLTLADAQRLGIDVDDLIYDQPSQTANGISYTAAIRLPEIKLGSIIINDIPAAVSKNLEGTSLLGMSFLEKLKEYRVENDTLTLTK